MDGGQGIAGGGGPHRQMKTKQPGTKLPGFFLNKRLHVSVFCTE
jgi:hypothetical protein